MSFSPISAEMPKSTTFAPVDVSMTLAGVTSRCTMPRECAAASAAETSEQMRTAAGHGSRRTRASTAARDSPSTSSITTYGTGSPSTVVASP